MSRYIDADKLQEAFKELHGGKRSLLIDTEHTADVRENVKGEWLPMKRFGGEKGQTPDVMCSVCHAPALWLGTLGCIRSNYCPNCGADMRPITALSKNAEIDSNLKRGEHLKNTNQNTSKT